MAITANKFLGKKKGGALAVRPKTNIVPVKGKGSSIEKVDPENPTLVIRTKLFIFFNFHNLINNSIPIPSISPIVTHINFLLI